LDLVSVDGGVVNEVGGNREIAQPERLPRFEVPEVVFWTFLAQENFRCINEVLSEFPNVNRSARWKKVHQAEMVLVGVADQDGIRLQPRDIYVLAIGTERLTDIEKDSGRS
jgi:hypothetical protein